jgi:uncharacterized protein (TIGR02391 family)
MAKRPPPPPPTESRIFRSTVEIDRAIAKLERRIADLDSLLRDNTSHADGRVRAVESDVRETIREVFGGNSPEFREHEYFAIYRGPVVRSSFGRSAPYPYQAHFQQAIPRARALLDGLVRRLREKREDLAEPEVAPRVAFEGRNLNETIATERVRSLFIDSHYAQAVFEASKSLVDAVKMISGRNDLDGAALMQHVFSVKTPALAFNNLSDDSDRDEQQGMMHLFTGAVLAIRNPRAHRADADDEPVRALQYLEFLSLLADRLLDSYRLR